MKHQYCTAPAVHPTAPALSSRWRAVVRYGRLARARERGKGFG